jgi:uncharacterized membrane protein YfcA
MRLALLRVLTILVPAVAFGWALGWLIGYLPASRWLVVLIACFALGWAVGQIRWVVGLRREAERKGPERSGLSALPGPWRIEQRRGMWWRIHDQLQIEDGPYHNRPPD